MLCAFFDSPGELGQMLKLRPLPLSPPNCSLPDVLFLLRLQHRRSYHAEASPLVDPRCPVLPALDACRAVYTSPVLHPLVPFKKQVAQTSLWLPTRSRHVPKTARPPLPSDLGCFLDLFPPEASLVPKSPFTEANIETITEFDWHALRHRQFIAIRCSAELEFEEKLLGAKLGTS